AYAGQDVEIALTYASDEVVQLQGVAIDDVAFTTGDGTTSFEDGDTGGWQVPGAPPPPTMNENDWFVAGVEDLPPALGPIIQQSLARQGEIIAFEESFFGDYPFRDAGAIVHHSPEVSFALENQTRPTYPGGAFGGADAGVSVMVHELAHQWFGDLVRVDTWQHTWLNEGFATYAQWLWSEHEGTPIDLIFDSFYQIPAESSFWQLVVADPGPELMFDFAVYARGAMTLHLLRKAVGDDTFFRILRRWGSHERKGTTADFIALAERIARQELDALFDPWLFTAGRPDLPASVSTDRAAAGDAAARQRAADLVRSIARQAGAARPI
ncbi:MAG TPA: M1 family aminopeptidase, partial [Kofleriaceae bacterium]|nr:M1 family aminopeptidase [Kofleriaceae bacterium]